MRALPGTAEVMFNSIGRKVRGPSGHKKWIEVTNNILEVQCHYTDETEYSASIDEAEYLAWQVLFEIAEARGETLRMPE